jgi:hypothetical protein
VLLELLVPHCIDNSHASGVGVDLFLGDHSIKVVSNLIELGENGISLAIDSLASLFNERINPLGELLAVSIELRSNLVGLNLRLWQEFT